MLGLDGSHRVEHQSVRMCNGNNTNPRAPVRDWLTGCDWQGEQAEGDRAGLVERRRLESRSRNHYKSMIGGSRKGLEVRGRKHESQPWGKDADVDVSPVE